ncbi:hypothetical protein BJF85_22575 [Saccharomonospora sp. CUA-673]|uniref:sulfite exporter TauE/SafE family protein n=1 Tax=Saccharomonospora sp. CUA-673 TaxID=1904969 RepID=UPI00095D89E9|nr:sulfite exporter TauE/SafE family protein [Saccharomonospora sp. CUA-673]OLT42509.1 hypothetical protein BJF85_22575 [Saccharomonospora sp. CUA-673]
MGWELLVVGFVAGLVIATVTAPVGVSGAVFLLPVQLDVLRVPSPAVTPTNLLFNVVSGPGALLRYRAQGQRPGSLTRLMLWGTLPGVLAGALVRVYLVPDVGTFRLVAAAVLLPIGVWLIWRTVRNTNDGASRQTSDGAGPHVAPSRRFILVAGLVVGVVGGVYGIGGGSILAPILVARGLSVVAVAPAALASTFVTSVVGALAFGVLALRTDGAVAPEWVLGLACGLGGLLGGYLGARWSRRLPERALTVLLGVAACGLAVLYGIQGLR